MVQRCRPTLGASSGPPPQSRRCLQYQHGGSRQIWPVDFIIFISHQVTALVEDLVLSSHRCLHHQLLHLVQGLLPAAPSSPHPPAEGADDSSPVPGGTLQAASGHWGGGVCASTTSSWSSPPCWFCYYTPPWKNWAKKELQGLLPEWACGEKVTLAMHRGSLYRHVYQWLLPVHQPH